MFFVVDRSRNDGWRSNVRSSSQIVLSRSVCQVELDGSGFTRTLYISIDILSKRGRLAIPRKGEKRIKKNERKKGRNPLSHTVAIPLGRLQIRQSSLLTFVRTTRVSFTERMRTEEKVPLYLNSAGVSRCSRRRILSKVDATALNYPLHTYVNVHIYIYWLINIYIYIYLIRFETFFSEFKNSQNRRQKIQTLYR